MESFPSGWRRHSAPLLLILILAVTFLTLSPALRGSFVNWDDPLYVLGNDLIRSLDVQAVGMFFTRTFEGNYHPLTLLSYAVEHALFGFDPFPYHLTNLLLHMANTLLVFLLSRVLLRSRRAALLCALIFGLHPLRVESVAWVSGRKDVLSGFFFFGSLLCYAASTGKAKQRLLQSSSFVLFVGALFSKPVAVTLPFALIIIDIFLRVPQTGKRWLAKAPFFALAGTVAAVTFLAQTGAGAVATHASFYGWRYPLTVLHSLWFYVSRTLVPVDLSAFYPYPSLSAVTSPGYLLGAFLGVCFILTLLPMGKGWRTYRMGGLFFVLTILPVLKILPVGNVPMADRYYYIPGIGLAWAFVGIHEFLSARRPILPRRAGAAGLILLASWFVLLAWQARERVACWKDSVALWSDVVGRHPNDFLAHFNLGRGHMEKGSYPEALHHFNRAVSLKPFLETEGRKTRDPHLYYYRGRAYYRTDAPGRAERDFLTAVEAWPDYTPALLELGILLAERGEYSQALSRLGKAALLQPSNPLAHYNLGLLYARLGDGAKAEAAFLRARELGYARPP